MNNDELKQLLPQSIDGLVRLRASLLITTACVDDLKKELADSAQSPAVERIESELAQAITFAREQEDLVRSLTDLINRLLRQYQSANDAYQAGWDARLDDILARVSVTVSQELLAMLQNIAIFDQPI